MKTTVIGLLKGRKTRWSMLALIITAAALTLGSSNERQYQLGGGFIGNNGAGNIWSAFQIPLDPAGRTAALRVNLMVYNDVFAGALSAFGADSLTESVGEEKMIGRDTAKYRTVGYANAQGNPPQRRAIVVMNGTVQFIGPDNFTVNYTLDMYPASADSNLDGYPDVGTTPAVTIPGVDFASRVPIP